MSIAFVATLFFACLGSSRKTHSNDTSNTSSTEPASELPDTNLPEDSGTPEDTDTAEPEPTDPAEIDGWELVWRDEFDGADIDLSLWGFEVNGAGGGNNELQYYTDRSTNARIEDGSLIIEAHQENYTGPDGTRDYTSARLRTKNRGDWKYGRIEARIRLPKGQGIWPAFWMLPTDNTYGTWPASGEIDIMELVGHEANIVHGTLHYGGIYPHHTYTGDSYVIDTDFSEAFHTFAVEWEAGEIRWYVDGIHTQTQTNWYTTEGAYPAPFDQRFHILLNIAVGGNWPGYPDGSTTFPQQMVVDYVRVYEAIDSEEPDPEPSDPTNLFTNAGFESVINNGTLDAPASWLIYPESLSNYVSEASGNPIYNSSESFLSFNGSRSLKVYGQFTGVENRTPVYQEFSASEGESYSLNIQAFTHSDDRISSNSRAVASIAFLDAGFNFLGIEYSSSLTASSTPNVWTELSVVATAPAGTQIVQGRVEFIHCEGQSSGNCFEGGSVYFDDGVLLQTQTSKGN